MSLGSGGGRLRCMVAQLLAVLGVLAIAGGAALGQVRRGLFESDAFASRFAYALNDPRVSAYVAERITQVVLREKPDLVAVRPLLRATAQSVVGTDAFQSVARVTAREAHAALFSKGGRNLLLSIPDVGLILRGALANASPTLAARVPERLSTVIASLGDSRAGRFIVDLWQLGRSLAWIAWGAVLGGLALLVAGIALAPRRSQALRRTGIDLVVAGVLLLLLVPVGRAIATSIPDTPLASQAAAGLFDAFARDVRQLGFGLGAGGLILSAAAYALVKQMRLSDTLRKVWARLTRPAASKWERLLRGLLQLGAGLFLALRPWTALTTVTIAAGAFLTFVGLQHLFALALRRPIDADRGEEAPPNRRVLLLVGAAVAAVVTIGLVSRTREPAVAMASPGCNGDERLCGRRLDQIVFPGTHNAMGSVDTPSWMFPQQERGLAGQLEDGVRALLIDVYGGVPVAGSVKTEPRADLMKEAERAVGKEGVEAAMRIRERLVGPPEGPRGLYLCHGFCELGAQALVPWLRVLGAFLVANPREVVIMVVEDYVPPAELAAAFAESGLDTLAYRGAPKPPWPTLAEMAASGQRLVVFLESGTPGVDWLHPAFEAMQETPYSFAHPSKFSCAVGRGGTAGSIFQVNHWIETPPMPKPSNAAIVNAHDFLIGRARACAEKRGHVPNILAVDFYRSGDLFGVVKELNKLAPEP